jgi:hypothetical protein
MRTSDIVGAVIGSMFALYNIRRMISAYSEPPSSLLEAFSINISVCVVCFFLNPDIMVFNTQFFNGKSIAESYKTSIIDSDYYFPESPMLFFLFVVSLLFSTISILTYLYVTRKTDSSVQNLSSADTSKSSTTSSASPAK